MNKLLANLGMRQRITIVVTILAAAAGLYSLIHWRQESDFRPLFTGLAAEDAAGIVQKLKESGVDYRIPDEGGAVLVPSSRRAELRLSLAAAGLPKSGRIGMELFDKTNLGATEFTEHVNYGRALEGELERSVMSLTEVDQARVHVTFPKESVFLDAQKPAKASVLVHLKPGAHLSPQNVQAIDHLVAAAVDGLSPDGVSVLDMNGNLLGRPRAAGSIDGDDPSSEAGLDYRRKIEADLVSKVNATLEPLLGAERFHAGVSVDCDFAGGEQSEEVFDPARSVMLSSQRTEDSSGPGTSSGVPGTASTLPRPTSRPGAGSTHVARVTENVTYQSTRTIKKMRLPAGAIRKISVAVLVDQELKWEKDKAGPQRVLVPPSAEKLKVIHDLVAGVTGFNAERGDQLVVETQPFETTLTLEPPQSPGTSTPGRSGKPEPAKLLQLNQQNLMIGGGVLVGVVLILFLLLRRGKSASASASVPMELPVGAGTTIATSDQEFRSRLAEHEAQQKEIDAQAALKLVPAITKTAEVMAKHLREKIVQSPEVSVQVLRGWIRDEDTER
ncbi:MAG TPA: flagellar basal-body MS-ring/collar protein FliF [Bryobacteraceae bacterium]|jgi:flagellar M-ring protein FliF|nr:flagellar basal-body MS-ring/collar protein FliF [Bryobacteraceae bacterium]